MQREEDMNFRSLFWVHIWFIGSVTEIILYLEDNIFVCEITQKDSARNSSMDRSPDRSLVPGPGLDSRSSFLDFWFSGYLVLLLNAVWLFLRCFDILSTLQIQLYPNLTNLTLHLDSYLAVFSILHINPCNLHILQNIPIIVFIYMNTS